MKSAGRPKILIVDDEHVIANTLATILNAAQYDVRAVYSGDSAVEVARTFQPDVLISDVIMPGKSGIEAAIEVLAMLPSCKILLFSGQAATTDLLKDARVHFEVLGKPLHPTDLLTRLQVMWAAG